MFVTHETLDVNIQRSDTAFDVDVNKPLRIELLTESLLHSHEC